MKLVYSPVPLVSPEHWDFDIVAVHGLLELPHDTWVCTIPQPEDPSHANKTTTKLHRRVDELRNEVQGGDTSASFANGQGNITSTVPQSGTTGSPSLNESTDKMRDDSDGEQRQKNSLKASSGHQVKDTSSEHRHEVNWLQDPDMLPSAFPRARIFQYGYEWKPNNTDSTLDAICHSAAKQLLSALARKRQTDKHQFPPKPIIFIGHSYGGIIIEYALSSARKIDDDKNQKDAKLDEYKDVVSSTVGVIFLATPFKLSQEVRRRWERLGIVLPTDLDSTSSTSKPQDKGEEQTTTMNSLTKAPAIESTNSVFVELVKQEGFRISCFYECLPSKDSTLGKVTSTTSKG